MRRTRHEPHSTSRSWRHLLRAIVLVGLGALLWASSTAQAQAQQAPLRMSVINVAADGGDQPRDQIVSVLENNPNIDLIYADELRAGMDNFAINDKILRKSELRAKFQSRITRLMRGRNVEGLLVIDVYSRGRKLQVVVIGPEGNELRDIKRDIRGGTIDKDQAIDILQTVFPALGPEVLAWRARTQPDEPEPEPELPEPPDQGDPGANTGQATEQITTPTTPEEPAPPGAISPGFELAVGAHLGNRSMTVREINVDPADDIQHRTPLVGVSTRLSAMLAAFGEGDSAGVGLDGYLAYAPFTTVFKQTDEDGIIIGQEEFESSFLRAGGQLGFFKMLSPSFRTSLFGGIEYLGLVIAQNPDYTGNSYLMARAGAQLDYLISPNTEVGLHGGVLPVLDADNSGGALGESSFRLSYEAGARFYYRFAGGFFVRLGYTFQFLQVGFPSPVPSGNSQIDAEADSRDLMNHGSVMIGLSL